MKPVRYVLLGCGHRANVLHERLKRSSSVELVGAWDPDVQRRELFWPHPVRSWEEMIRGDVDWVLVVSPNLFHKEQIVASLEAGKHVFSEKPLATTTPDCLALAKAARNSEQILMTGFTLRYSGLYRTVKQLLSDGVLGRLVSIDATENLTPGHGAYIMTNWRRDYRLAGSNILEKCVHDLDLLNWFTDSLPRRVAAFGGTDVFVPQNAALFERSPRFSDKAATKASGLNPFTAEKGIEDNLVSILEFANGVRAQFQLTSSNPIPERRMYLSGTEGTAVLDLVTGTLKCKTLYETPARVWSENSWGDGHGGGDNVMVQELVETMTTGKAPATGIEEGLRSTLVGIALDTARREQTVLNLDSTWKALEAAR